MFELGESRHQKPPPMPLDASYDEKCWAGTYHGRHHGTKVRVEATFDDSLPEQHRYGWVCTCGALSQRFEHRHDLDRSADRHAHPTRWDRLIHKIQGRRAAQAKQDVTRR